MYLQQDYDGRNVAAAAAAVVVAGQRTVEEPGERKRVQHYSVKVAAAVAAAAVAVELPAAVAGAVELLAGRGWTMRKDCLIHQISLGSGDLLPVDIGRHPAVKKQTIGPQPE